WEFSTEARKLVLVYIFRSVHFSRTVQRCLTFHKSPPHWRRRTGEEFFVLYTHFSDGSPATSPLRSEMAVQSEGHSCFGHTSVRKAAPFLQIFHLSILETQHMRRLHTLQNPPTNKDGFKCIRAI